MIVKFVQILGLLKEWAVPIASYFGICISIYGLQIWKRQHRWKVEFDIARKLLPHLYEYRHVLLGARVRQILIYECPEAKENPEKYSKKGVADLLECAFRYRMSRVAQARAKLAASVLEAEAIWGNWLKEQFLKLFEYEQELGIAQVRYVKNMRVGKTELNRDVEKIVFGAPNDDFERKVQAVIYQFERFLKSKLRV